MPPAPVLAPAPPAPADHDADGPAEGAGDGAPDAPDRSAAGVLHVRHWPDAVLDQHGHDPRGDYAELFWIPMLGPSATLLLRRLVDGLDRVPSGFDVPVADLARMIGLGYRDGRRGPFGRTVVRLEQFRLVFAQAEDTLLVRRRLPGLTRTQVGKLPPVLRDAHDAWRRTADAAPALPILRERARTLALTLVQLGEAPADVLAHLRRLRFHPAVADDALRWAAAHLPAPTDDPTP